MAYRHFNIMLFVRITLIVAMAIGIGLFIASKTYPTLVVLIIFELIAIWELIRFLNKTNKLISFFIQAVKNEDTSLRFSPKTGNATVNELHKNLNELNVILQQVKVNSEIKEKYFSEILQNIATGVVVINNDGFVNDVNHSALELLGLETFTHLSQLDRVDSKLKMAFSEIDNRQKKIIPIKKANERIQVITRCSIINLKEENVKLITLQDIRSELERKEIDSWVKLIRVLSHEIMNSLAPVTSIAQSLQGIWEKKSDGDIPIATETNIEKTINGLGVISEMSESLIRFVQSYRILSKAPSPKLTSIEAHSFFDRLNILISPMKEDFNGSLTLTKPANNFKFTADEQMMVQVIINLVKNAVEALSEDKSQFLPEARIEVAAIRRNEITKIQIKDNGKGIPEEILDEIFIPFFTTKENGSGIGLSYSRQIIRAHGGSLSCRSKLGETVFVMKF